MVRIMNTPPANFGIPTLVAANAPPLTPKTSGDTSGSFALEISSRWQCNPAPEPLLKAGAPMDVGKQQADPQKQAKSVTSSGFPYPFLMQGVAVTNEPRNAPSGEPSGTPNASASTRSGTGEALPTDSQGTSAREITLSWGTAGIASAAFGLRLPISAGSVASTQTTGIPASPFSLSSNFSQISHKVEPAGVITPPVAEQTNPVGLPVVEERGHSLLGTASSAVNVTNQTSSPDTQQDAKAVAVASSPAAGQTEQVGRWQVQDAASLGANAILNPAAQLNLTDRPETYWAHGQPAAAFPATTGETKNAALPAALHDLVVQVLARQPQVPRGGAGESNPQSKSGQTVSANLPVAGTSLDSLVPGAPSAAGVFATPSESSLHELVSQILARQPQVVGDGVGESNPQPKFGQTVSANPPVAGTSLDSLVPGAPSAAGILATPSTSSLHELVTQILARQPQVVGDGVGESDPQPKSSQTVSANPPVAGTSLDSLIPGAPSAAGILATPSESSLHELVSQILARQPQALGDGVGQSNPQPKSGQTVSANPPVAGTSLDSLVPGAPSEARILVTQPESFLGKPQTGDAINLAHDAGQDKDGNTAVTAGASGTEGNPRSPGSSRGVTVTVPSPSSNPQLRSPASDKSKESDRVGSSPSSKEGTPRTDRTAGAVPDWTQAGGDTDAAADGSSPGGQTASATDRSPVSLKIASLVSAGQKVVAAEPDTGPGIAIDPSQAMRRGSDAQRDSATTSTESAGRAAPPALQNWDAIRQQLGQIVSSAHLAEAMGQSELQVDMKSDSLGPVSVRAILNNGQIGAEIQVSNHDARAVLTEGLHTLEKTLGEKGLQVVNLDVSQGLDYSHAQSQGQQGKQAGQAAHAAKGYTDHSVSKPELSEVSNTANWTGDFVLGRVSVHA